VDRRRSFCGAILGCATFAVVALSCANSSLPGTMLGTYAVTGTLGTNSCGTGLAPPSPWAFDVQMSEEGTTLYWSYLDGNPPLSSTLSANAATLTATQTANVDGTADGGAGPCSMTRTDTLQVDLAAANPPPTFTGTLVYDFTVVSGADCSDQLSANGGSYDTLPCTLTYSLSGAQQ
jgi:hypothetical protein